MLEGVLDLPATQVREIMTPRPQVHAIASLMMIYLIFYRWCLKQSILAILFLTVLDDDAVVGILLIKDSNTIPKSQADGKEQPLKLADIVRKPLYISETARSDTLLRSLQKPKCIWRLWLMNLARSLVW